jgi:DNA-binding transcriptional ArsR family regulator
VLKGAGLIAERREGTRRYYRARPEGLADVRAFLDGLWDEKLQSLKREVERG